MNPLTTILKILKLSSLYFKILFWALKISKFHTRPPMTLDITKTKNITCELELSVGIDILGTVHNSWKIDGEEFVDWNDCDSVYDTFSTLLDVVRMV